MRSVEVDGRPASFTSTGEDLVVTPESPLAEGSWTRITVRHTSDPVAAKDQDGGWVRTTDGLAMANQTDAAHLVFPCNDHPSDKAMFTFHVTAPNGYTAVANGLPAGADRACSTTTWTYRTRHPMATELAQVSIGRSTVLRREGPHGLPVRDVVPGSDAKALEPWLAKTPGQIAWMESKVGAFPFETYGLLMAQASTGFELETQTLSLFEKNLFTEPAYPRWYVESVMVHELSHQWFGDSVSPRTWSDVWLNEGHATWYEELYAQETAHRPMEERMKAAYGASDRWRQADGPPARPKPPAPGQKIGIFRPNVYDGAALVLYALRQEIGHGLRAAGARLGRRAPGFHCRYRRLRPAGLGGLRPRPDRLLQGMAVRREDPADAGPPGLEAAGPGQGRRPRRPRRAPPHRGTGRRCGKAEERAVRRDVVPVAVRPGTWGHGGSPGTAGAR